MKPYCIIAVSFFFLSTPLRVLSQNQAITVTQFKDYKANIIIDFDSIQNNLPPDPLSITLIIFRAESYPTNSTISFIRDKINSFCPLVRVISYELESTAGVNFCYFNIISNRDTIPAKPIPPKFWITTSDPILLSKIENDLGLVPYRGNRSFLTKDIDKNKVYDEINNIISNYCALCLNEYIDFFLINKNELIKSLIDKLSHLDSAVTYAHTTNRNKSFLTLSYNFPLSTSLHGINQSKFDSKYKGGYSLSLAYKRYINKWFGYGFETNLSKLSLKLTSGNDITDTTPGMTDSFGDRYDKIIYAKGIQENISIHTFSIIPQLSIKYQNNKQWQFSFGPGIKFSWLMDSEYNATDGKISYGGLYPQYSNDTIFSGLYDFYQNQPAYSEKQTLLLKRNMISLFLPLSFNIPVKKLYLGIGVYYEIGLTNILQREYSNHRVISETTESYNSLLYRYDVITINTFALRAAISYKF